MSSLIDIMVVSPLLCCSIFRTTGYGFEEDLSSQMGKSCPLFWEYFYFVFRKYLCLHAVCSLIAEKHLVWGLRLWWADRAPKSPTFKAPASNKSLFSLLIFVSYFTGTANITGGAQMYFVSAYCGSSGVNHCPPYINARELACVMCTK